MSTNNTGIVATFGTRGLDQGEAPFHNNPPTALCIAPYRGDVSKLMQICGLCRKEMSVLSYPKHVCVPSEAAKSHLSGCAGCSNPTCEKHMHPSA